MSTFDIPSKLIEEETQSPKMVDSGLTKPVFVDTDLHTHFVVLVSSLFTVQSLKREICVQHFKCFPEYGNITVKSVLVKFNEAFYHLPDSILLKTVFRGMGDTWFISADIWTPVVSQNCSGFNKVESSPKGQKKSKKKNDQMVTNDVPTSGFDIVVKDAHGFFGKQDENTVGCEGLLHTSVVQPSPKLLDDGENVFGNLETGGNDTNVAETLNKESGVDNIGLPIGAQVKKTGKRKKSDAAVSQSHAVTAPRGPDIPELLSQRDPLNLERDVEKNSALFNSGNITKKRKTNESEQENRRNDEKALLLHLNNAPELLSSQHKPRKIYLFDKIVEFEKNIESYRNAAKKSKNENRKAKNSGIKKQDLSSEIQNDDHNAEPEGTSRPEESKETMSRMLKETRNMKHVPEKYPPRSPVEEKLDEANREMGTPTTVIQSDKRKKKRRRQQLVPVLDHSSLPVNQPLKETTEGTNAPEQVELADCETNDEPLNLVEREKEMKEDIVPSKSEKIAKKKKDIEVKCSGVDTQDMSRKRENDDQNAINTRGELLFQDAIGRPEKSVETMSVKVKKSSRTKNALPAKDLPKSLVEEQPDEVVRENIAPVSVIPSKSTKKRSQTKQPAVSQDLSSLPANQQHLDEKVLEMDAPKIVEQDDFMTNCDKDDGVDQNKVIQDEENQDELCEIPSQQVSSDFTDLKHLEKLRASEHKEKKLDQASSIDTLSNGHNLVESKKDRDGTKTKLLQKFVTEQEYNKSIPPLTESLVPQADLINSEKVGSDHASVNKATKVSDANFATETDSSKRVKLAAALKEVTQAEDDHVQFRPLHWEVSPILPEARLLGKPRASKTAKKLDPPSSIDTSSSGHHLVGSKKNRRSTKTSELQKFMIDQKHDKSIPPLSAKRSTIPKEAIDTRDATKTLRKSGVVSRSADDESEASESSLLSSRSTLSKIRKKIKTNQPKKMEMMNSNPRRSSHLSEKEAVNNPAQKKGLLASSGAIFEDGSSSSSDDNDKTEDRTNASSLSTTIAQDNSSSSGCSEGESKRVRRSKDDSSKGNGKSAYSSGIKLESILRSSSRYKNAKLVASQTQVESQPLEFVPDSQADM